MLQLLLSKFHSTHTLPTLYKPVTRDLTKNPKKNPTNEDEDADEGQEATDNANDYIEQEVLPTAVSISSASSNDPTDTESVQQAPLEGWISPFHLAIGLWCEKSSISRTDYIREVWHMAMMERLMGIHCSYRKSSIH
jgi:hypothetical protein